MEHRRRDSWGKWSAACGAIVVLAVTGSSAPGESLNAFKIPTLWGVAQTAPYFHDNSAGTLEDVLAHYAKFFAIISTPPGSGAPGIDLTKQDQADIVAFLKLLR